MLNQVTADTRDATTDVTNMENGSAGVTDSGARDPVDAPALLPDAVPGPLDVAGASTLPGPQRRLAIVTADQKLTDVSVDATGVYFAVAWYSNVVDGPPGSDTQGAIRLVDSAGGLIVELWQGQGAACQVAVGASAVYFVTYEYRSRGRDGFVWTVPRTGGVARKLASWFSQGSSTGLAVDRDIVYWSHSLGAGGNVERTDALAGTKAALVTGVGSPRNLAALGGYLFYVSDAVYSVPAAGGTAVKIWDHAGTNDNALAASAANAALYVATQDAGLVKVPTGGGAPMTVATGSMRIADVVTDARSAYWIDAASGEIRKTSLDGGGPVTVLATGLLRGVALAVDDAFVYWLDDDAHAVMRAPKK